MVESTVVRISWEDGEGNHRSGIFKMPGWPVPPIEIEMFHSALETPDLIAPAGMLEGFKDNPYLDLFRPGEYQIVDSKEAGSEEVQAGMAQEGSEAAAPALPDPAPDGDR